MKKPDRGAQLGFVEKLLQGLDEGLPGALLRVCVGFATIPAVRRFLGNHNSDWALLPGLFTVFLLLRAVPVVIRAVIPFSYSIQVIWWNRRQLAKRYDSYQWRKLFWIGVGMSIYIGFYGDFSSSHITISSFCILVRAIGLIKWRVVGERSQQSTTVKHKVIRPVA